MKKIYIGVVALCAAYASPQLLADSMNTSAIAQHYKKQSYFKGHAKPMKKKIKGQFKTVAEQQLVTANSSDADSAKPLKLESSLGIKPSSRFHLNGFLSAGFSKANTGNDSKYAIPGHGAVGKNITFAPNSLIGLQLQANLTPKISIVGEFVANGDSSNGQSSYRVNSEWAFLRFKVNDNFQIQAGRFRLPLFLYSDTQQVGYSYTWMSLPNEVYRIVPFENMNGVDIVYHYPLGSSGWALQVQPFYGANSSGYDIYATQFMIDNIPALKTEKARLGDFVGTAEFNEDNLVGANIQVGNQNIMLHGAYAHIDLSSNNLKGMTLPSSSADFYSFGAKFDQDNFLAAAEYAHRSVPSKLAALSGFYGMVGYRLGAFVPNFTFGHITTTNAPTLEAVQKQNSYTLGLAYYLGANVLIKASGAEVFPYDGPGLFTKLPTSNHVFVYGAEVDAIF